MATQLQIRRGTSTQVAAFTGAEGEIVVNTTNDSVHVNDGSTQGGFELARVDGSNWAVTNSISISGSITTSEDQSGLLTLGRFSSGVPYSLIRPSTNATGLEIRTFAGNALARFLNSGVTELYNNASLRLSTTSTGIALTSTGATDVTLQDTDGGFSASKINVQNGGRDLKVTAPQDIILNVGSSDVVNIINGGNIGINTTNPEYVLDVDDGTGNAYIAINRLTQSQGEVGYKLDGGTSGGDWFIYQKTGGDDLNFYQGIDRVTFMANGNVGIGTGTSVSAKFHVAGSPQATSGALALLRNSDATASNTTFGGVFFSSSPGTDFSIGKSNVNTATTLSFRNGNTGASLMDLTSSGNLLIGTTSNPVGNNVVGIGALSNGNLQITRDGGLPLHINRKTDAGALIDLRSDGTSVGSIGVVAGNNVFINGDTIGLAIGDDNVYPANASGASTDGATDLGDAVARWRNLYLSGGAFLGGTTSANFLDDYEEGTWTPTYTATGTNPSSVTYNIQVGRYIKIGHQVVAQCRIRTDGSLTQGSGALYIAGLPFNSQSVVNVFGGAIIHYTQNWATNNAPARAYQNANESRIVLVRYDTNDPRQEGSTSVDAGSLATGSNSNDVICTIIYSSV